MAKSTLQAIAAVIAERYELKGNEATAFVAAFFEQIREGLAQDKQVKVRGLGTFKLQPVKARESVNVNTGERVVISSHDKMVFTPDNAMKELVNRPFADFETVMIKDGVDLDSIPTPFEPAASDDGDEPTAEMESESPAEDYQPTTEERPPVTIEEQLGVDHRRPVTERKHPATEETLPVGEEERDCVEAEISEMSQSEAGNPVGETDQRKGEEELLVAEEEERLTDAQPKSEPQSETTTPTQPHKASTRPRKLTPAERFSQLMGEDEEEQENAQAKTNDRTRVVTPVSNDATPHTATTSQDEKVDSHSTETQASTLTKDRQNSESEEVEKKQAISTLISEPFSEESDSQETTKADSETEQEQSPVLPADTESEDREEHEVKDSETEKTEVEKIDSDETASIGNSSIDGDNYLTDRATEEEIFNKEADKDEEVTTNEEFTTETISDEETTTNSEETSPWTDPEDEEEKIDTAQSHLVRNVVLPIVALLSVIAIATGAYYYGKSQQETPLRPATPEVAKPQSSTPQPTKTEDSVKAKAEKPAKVEKELAPAQAKDLPNEGKEAHPKSSEGIDLTAANNYPKLRYGAYRIIGVEKKLVLRPGETMEKVCRRTLGKDMMGYFEAINGKEHRSAGDTILIPKVELRPEYRK